MESQEVLEAVRELVASDKDGFSTETFSSSGMLIDVMKAKSSRESLQQRTDELVERQNEVEDLVEDIASAYSDSFDLVLQSPALYGQQIEKLRGCIATAKKKITASKQSLLKNDKDLQQLNFNSLFNKLVYNKLKSVESEVAKLQAAASHIKHNRYLDCSLSLPILTGRTLLEDHIQNKAEALKDELYTACSMQVYAFCYLTGDVVLPSQSSMLERMKEHRGSWHLDESVPNMEEHLPLYEKYRLLRDIDLQGYLKFLWQWEDYERKGGKLAVIYDVVRAVFNIGRSQQLLEFISLNFRKAVVNLYLLILIFLVYDEKTLAEGITQLPPRRTHFRSFFGQCGFNSKQKLDRLLKFFGAAVCFLAVLARKFVIIRKIYQEFRIDAKVPEIVAASAIIELAISQLVEYLAILFFPREQPPEEVTPLRKFLSSSLHVLLRPSFLEFPFVRRQTDAALRNVLENLLIVKEVELESSDSSIKSLKELKANFHQRLFKEAAAGFSKELETKWLECVYSLLNSHTNRLFLPIVFSEHEAMVDLSDIHQHLAVKKSLSRVKQFISEDKKQIIKEPVACAFYLEELTAYTLHLNLQPSQPLRLSLFLVMMLYLRINNHAEKTFFEEGELRNIDMEAQKKSKFFLDMQERCYKQLPSLFRREEPEQEGSNLRKKESRRRNVINGVSADMVKRSSSIFAQFRLNDKLRVLVSSIQYFLVVIDELLKQELTGAEMGPLSREFDRRLQNHQAMNLDDNMMMKAKSLFDSLPQETAAIRQCFLALCRRFVMLFIVLKCKCGQITTA